MPIITSPSQQVRTRALRPKSVYSRVILLQRQVATGTPNPVAILCTPPLGKLWLLSIDVWILPISATGFTKAYFRLKHGVGAKKPCWNELTAMEDIMQARTNYGSIFVIYGHDPHLHFDMAQYYDKEPVLLACGAQQITGGDIFWVTIAFQISEG